MNTRSENFNIGSQHPFPWRGGGSPSSYYDRAIAQEKEYLDPFIERGGRAGEMIEGQYGQLVSDPTAMLEKFMGGYKTSPFTKMLQERMTQAAANTAAAGGMRGSPSDQFRQQQITQDLLGKDMQQYLSNVLGLYGTGLGGESSLYGTGFQGARGLSSDVANMLGQQAQLAFQQEREKQQRGQDLFGGALGALGSFFGGGLFG